MAELLSRLGLEYCRAKQASQFSREAACEGRPRPLLLIWETAYVCLCSPELRSIRQTTRRFNLVREKAPTSRTERQRLFKTRSSQAGWLARLWTDDSQKGLRRRV